MKILHELNQLAMGGAERVVHGIIKNDPNNEYTVYSYKDGPMRKPLEDAGAKVFVDDGKATHDIEADIIHIHTGGNLSRLADAVRGEYLTIETIHSPVVSVVRDDHVFARVGVSNQVTKQNRKCRTIHNGIDVERLLMYPEWTVKHESYPSEGHAPVMIRSGYVSCKQHLGIPDDAFVVGRVGRIGHDKCLEAFLVACKKAQDSNLIRDMHIIITGDEAEYSKGYLSKVKIMAASLPLSNVHFIPALEEVGWVYEALDVFLYPSPTEGFGLVYLEAMTCKIPVITWENPVTKELLLGAAQLTQPTISALAEAIIYLYIQPALRHNLAVTGQETALNYFTASIMSDKYQKLYAELFRQFYPERANQNESTGP